MSTPSHLQKHLVFGLALALGVGAAATFARAGAPACRFTVSGPVATDTVTQLSWQRTAMTGTFDWAGAVAACNALSLGSPSGGWRLPTAAEAQTILDEASTGITLIDLTVFTDPGALALPFWTATVRKDDANLAWAMSQLSGQTTAHDKTEKNLVRCVR